MGSAEPESSYAVASQPYKRLNAAAFTCDNQYSQTSGDQVMANEMPSSESYTGLSRKVLQYSENFKRIADKARQGTLTDADWAPMETLVDVQNFRRHGVFLTDTMEYSTWQQYKAIVTQYGGMTQWEGTLRRITEVPGLVFLELEERNTRDGVTDVSRTVTIYKFNEAGKLIELDVFVGHIGKH
jgi:hypothetical protein